MVNLIGSGPHGKKKTHDLFCSDTETLAPGIRSRASYCFAFMGFWVISTAPPNKKSGPSWAIALTIRCLGRRGSHSPGSFCCPVQGMELDSMILMSPFQVSIFCDSVPPRGPVLDLGQGKWCLLKSPVLGLWAWELSSTLHCASWVCVPTWAASPA